MEKIDLRRKFPLLYKASARKCDIITVPKLHYLMCDGKGDPNNSVMFQDVLNALYSLAYAMKFMLKKESVYPDYGIMPLEGLWWTDDMNNFSVNDKAAWKWTLMILQPDFIVPEIVERARTLAASKKQLPKLAEVRLEYMEEGECAQLLHIGPYNMEAENIQRLHTFIKECGCKLHGKHREIYLSDMRKTAPEKLKTIIRQPMRK